MPLDGSLVYAAAAVALLLVGAGRLLTAPEIVRKIVALNVMAAGAALLLLSLAGPEGPADPAAARIMAIAGIVVAAGVSAFGLWLARRIRMHAAAGTGAE